MSNIGSKWTKTEEEQLLTEIKTMRVREIAKTHERKEGGIRARLYVIAGKLVNNESFSIEEASHAVNIPAGRLEKNKHYLKAISFDKKYLELKKDFESEKMRFEFDRREFELEKKKLELDKRELELEKKEFEQKMKNIR